MPAGGTRLSGIYAVTEPRAELVPAVQAALRGGVRIVQYRDKGGDAARRREEASALLRACEACGALLIINDDVALAGEVGAHGVHLGAEDLEVSAARQQLGVDAWIGASCYSRLERARRMAAEGADYVAFGSVFPSPTKPDAVRAPLELLREGREATGLPTVAIGGIDADNVGQVAAAGADAAAVVSALLGADDPEGAARTLVAEWQRSQ